MGREPDTGCLPDLVDPVTTAGGPKQ